MLYLAIDLHSRQITVNLRLEDGTVFLRRQVSTKGNLVREFLHYVGELAKPHGGFVTIVEVCGFEDWLLKLLDEAGCSETLLVQSKERAKRKTDRIDANKLGELLWINRLRLAAGEKLQQLRRIHIPSDKDKSVRRLTELRVSLGRHRTRTTNQIHRILRKHNLGWDCPTKGLRTIGARKWLETLPLPELDRIEMNLLLARWTIEEAQIDKVDKHIKKLDPQHPLAALLRTIPGLGGYSGLAIACRIPSINHFPRDKSLANFWGLAPGCRNSGETRQRIGSITKEGSTIVRFLLGQAVLHVLRKCPRWKAWYKGIKARRGSKIARVAVMRRLATAIWRMVKHSEPFDPNAGFRTNAAKTPPAPRATGDRREQGPATAGEGTSRTPSSLPPNPQPPSPLPCSR
jgi:transposase